MKVKFLVLRSGRALVAPGGGLPGEEVLEHVAPIQTVEVTPSLSVVTAATGDPPDGYKWVSVAEVQRTLGDEESDLVGEALLCA